MNIWNYVIKKIISIIPILFLSAMFIFILMRTIPGDPALTMLGEKATPESIAMLNEKWGLNQSYLVQFYLFIKGALIFDFGTSIKYGQPVIELLSKKLLITLSLVISSSFFAILLGIIPGYLAGMYKGKFVDYFMKVLSLIFLACPPFWVGLLLITVFSVHLRIFPISGWGSTISQHILGMILPGITQGLCIAAIIARNLRNDIIDVAKKDYVLFAKSKGLSNVYISLHYILRNALIPIVTILSMRIAYMLGGSVVVETVFGLPGIGALLINSIFARDYPVVQGIVLVFVLLVILINLITDTLYHIIDPKVNLN